MMKSNRFGTLFSASLLSLTLGLTLSPTGEVGAAIAQSPLILADGVKSNLLMVVDNSGSMDFESLYPTNDGALWWNTTSTSFWGVGRGGSAGLNYNDAGAANTTWRKYTYLFPVTDGTRISGDGQFDHFAVPPTAEFAFARSPQYNGQYYDPSVTYAPWRNGGGYTFVAANASAARTDPLRAGSTTVDLTGNLTQSFRLHPGMRKPDGSVMTTSDQQVDYDFPYKPAVYYLRVNSAVSYTIGGKSYDCAAPDPSAYPAFVANPGALPTGIAAIAPDGYCLARHDIASGTAEMQNFANWFEYYRKRHLALRGGMGEAFNGIGGIRAGGTPINGRPNSIAMYDLDTQRDDVYKFFYDIGGYPAGTPNRQALNFANDQYEKNESIIQYACQKNFVLQFTDGFSDPDTSSGVGNADGAEGSPYADSYGNTIADIAMRYYKRVRGDLEGGKVPVPAACAAAKPAPWLDCNRDPHVNYYGITLGARGNIFGTTHKRVADAYAQSPAWVNPTAQRSPVQVDDLYHAAINGRGEMLNATSSKELTTRLQEALADILARGGGSGSRTASSSSRGGGGNQLFQARFDAAEWTGDVIAHEVRADGTLGKQNWSAAAQMPAAASRKISYGPAAKSFAWAQLDAATQAAFNRNPLTGVVDNAGERRVNWLRGDRAAQGASNGLTLRERKQALGDIVNSNPRYVGTDNYAYDRLPAGAAGRDEYAAFRFGKSARKPMVYVGANDGMLHAFAADDGVEQWAWIPSEFLATTAAQPVPAMAQLPRSDYSHRYYVDGQPIAGDAWFGSKWHTVLLVPMGAGGRSIAALDVTDPASGPKVLWEYTDADLGYFLGQPSIQRMANGQFAAIFGSGYGLDASAKLFVVDIETGKLIRKIDTDPAFKPGSGHDNGLSAPYPVDVNGDAIIDMVYAGDLRGNMWRFDVDDAVATDWAVHHGNATAPKPLVSVCASGDVGGIYACPASARQPITVRPVVGRGANGLGQTVYFGTGKLFESGDGTVPASGATGPVQSFYAVFDDNAVEPVAGRSKLREQTILSEEPASAPQFRITSANVLEKEDRGWYLDLVSPLTGFRGERVISDPVLRGGRIIFTTFMPKAGACEGGSDGWLMELGAEAGARFVDPVIDTNGDGVFNDDDKIDGKAVSGVRGEDGAPMVPSIVTDEKGNEKKHLQGAGGGTPQKVGERGAIARGRTSWRQFWP